MDVERGSLVTRCPKVRGDAAQVGRREADIVLLGCPIVILAHELCLRASVPFCSIVAQPDSKPEAPGRCALDGAVIVDAGDYCFIEEVHSPGDQFHAV